MILTSGLTISQDAIRRQISAALNLIVQQEQLVDGSRKITHITEIRGLKDGDIIMEDIFSYDIENIDAGGKVIGRWVASGIKPLFYPRFHKMNIAISEDIFNKG
jgi:pilus assembly protein CpaF